MKHLKSVQMGIDYIEANLDKHISLTDVSSHAKMSHWHFQRIFKALTNETLKSYVRARRITNSLDRVLKSEGSILDIALDAGFQSHEAYTKAFQRLYGCTPIQYRQKFGQPSIFKKPKIDDRYLTDLHQHVSLEPRIYVSEEKHLVGMKEEVIGIESEHTNIAEKLPKLWQDFVACMREVPNRVDEKGYGVISVENTCGTEQRLFYTACVEVSSLNDIPSNMVSVTIPRQRYAEFRHKGRVDVESFNTTISYIYSSWLLQSNVSHTYGYDIETYGDEFHPDSDDSVVYYAIPINV
ncbi:AraC family transcriptional regulator [Agaribacter marinus]|uniref:Transcriptional regulator n=1 Tax=Agaribacter marinus TaxID=1431249 RepID=A0AA37T687_9ALTE|nr:effector binding domain-containing protein [Agaribacter marinus]GLR72115.1 transcriptional regulator [Agaribacter marinus]